MQPNSVIIGIGSNILPEANVKRSIEILRHQFDLLKVTNAIRTKPREFKPQADFLNAAALIKTKLSRLELKALLRQIESDLGRVRTANKAGPRTIDLDILVYDGEVVDDKVYEWDFLEKLVVELMPHLKRQRQLNGE